jgi:catechol 2,3-dioxygenase-like lactoylglutathione lyase family enzyme
MLVADLRTMEGRPAVWIGHASLSVSDLGRSADFWSALGMREVVRNAEVAVLELRGGTHLVLVRGSPPTDADAPFDLMVDDLESTHTRWSAQGLEPSPINHGSIHSMFTVRDPDGYRLTVNSSHVVGPV